jgi:hypothetical protein
MGPSRCWRCENIQDDSGGGDCGAEMQGASMALAKPNGPMRAYRIIRAVGAVPLVSVFTERRQSNFCPT